MDTSQCNTHNFQIGVATTAAQVHIPEAHIKVLGRWHSGAFQWYICEMLPQECEPSFLDVFP